jgi:hypothetical protein
MVFLPPLELSSDGEVVVQVVVAAVVARVNHIRLLIPHPQKIEIIGYLIDS